jgi:hypothetical protein
LVTAKIPLTLAITAEPASVTFGGSLIIEGTLAGTGSGNAVVQLQENPYPYTAGFTSVGNPELTFSNGQFSFNVLAVDENTQYRVISGGVASTDVSVTDALGVTLNAIAGGSSTHPTIHFSGEITPSEPYARLAVERLIGSSWKVIGGTTAGAGSNVSAGAPADTSGTVNFGITVHVHSGGFFRVLVLPVVGSQVNGYSSPVLVKIK